MTGHHNEAIKCEIMLRYRKKFENSYYQNQENII